MHYCARRAAACGVTVTVTHAYTRPEGMRLEDKSISNKNTASGISTWRIEPWELDGEVV